MLGTGAGEKDVLYKKGLTRGLTLGEAAHLKTACWWKDVCPCSLYSGM